MAYLIVIVIVAASVGFGFLLGLCCEKGLYINCTVDESMNKTVSRDTES